MTRVTWRKKVSLIMLKYEPLPKEKRCVFFLSEKVAYCGLFWCEKWHDAFRKTWQRCDEKTLHLLRVVKNELFQNRCVALLGELRSEMQIAKNGGTRTW